MDWSPDNGGYVITDEPSIDLRALLSLSRLLHPGQPEPHATLSEPETTAAAGGEDETVGACAVHKEKNDGRFQHAYSNASYTMASAMLERVSGLSYEDLVTRTLTDDLGLSVHIGWPNSICVDQPWGHMITKDKVESFPPDHDYKLPHLITPAGDSSMTPKHYAQYTQLHLRGLGGHDNYLSNEAYRHIHFGHDGFSLGVVNGALGGRDTPTPGLTHIR